MLHFSCGFYADSVYSLHSWWPQFRSIAFNCVLLLYYCCCCCCFFGGKLHFSWDLAKLGQVPKGISTPLTPKPKPNPSKAATEAKQADGDNTSPSPELFTACVRLPPARVKKLMAAPVSPKPGLFQQQDSTTCGGNCLVFRCSTTLFFRFSIHGFSTQADIDGIWAFRDDWAQS